MSEDLFNAFLHRDGPLTLPGVSGLLDGRAVAVKDNIAVAGWPLTCGSRILEGHIAPYHATVVERILRHGGRIIGKTNLDEFAMGSSNEHSAYGPVRHPLDRERVPGGSSGGSAVAVASGLADVALGSDTGGSVRQPAAFCGVYGLKPTYGRVSRYGLTAFASSFDQIGIFARTAEETARLLQVIAGHDPKDATSLFADVPRYCDLLEDSLPRRIGIPTQELGEGLEGEIRARLDSVAEFLKEEGCEIVEISLPRIRYAIATYYVLTMAEASSNLARFDGVRYGPRREGSTVGELYRGSRGAGFGEEVKRRIMLGTYVLSAGYYEAYYGRAQKVRRLIQADFLAALKSVDLILLPTTPTTAFRLGEKLEDPLQMYLADTFTTPASLAGLPALSFPAGVNSRGLPIGLQLIGRFLDEATILRLANFIEQRHHP